eukprot:TRINITY_DN48012_c0_g1_i1.p1 TRINITY_DN48012_c0_g1~~TRINITY_DN48012_c0_g1_i1.p1  ORF type:complete len:480 (-),score=69.98 TRINITY_DN48012_c0_g1_i1:31-1470(-)
MNTEAFEHYCAGPLWTEEKVPDELAARLASIGAPSTGTSEAASFVVTPELLHEPVAKPPKALGSFAAALQSMHGAEPASLLQKTFFNRRRSEGSLEYVWEGDRSLKLSSHGFISAVVTAWSEHLPLVLKPEHIWQLILQGITAHVDADPEGVRKNFVDFDGKNKLGIRRDEFVKGSATNDWGGAVEEIAELLDSNVKPAPRAVFGTRFSTTSRGEQLCSSLSAMAMCKNFFDYNCATFCGFPTVTLLGSLEDWQHLRHAAELAIRNLCHADGVVAGICRLLHMDFCERWLSALLPTLDRFIDAYQGQVDAVFWNSMLKRGGRAGSGGFTGYTGWFNVFFPKIKKSFNRFCVPYCDSADYARAGLRESWSSGNKFYRNAQKSAADTERDFAVQHTSDYPDGTEKVPMTWNYHELEFPMEFVSGFVGYTQDPDTRAIMPVLSWYLLDKTPGVKVDEEALAVGPTACIESLRAQLAAARAGA